MTTARFKAEFEGTVLGWYDTLIEAETAIAIAADPYGSEAMAVVVCGQEAYLAALVKATYGD